MAINQTRTTVVAVISLALLTGCTKSPPSNVATSNQVSAAPEVSSGDQQAGPLFGKTIVVDPGHNGGNAAHPEIINKKVDIITGKKACNTTGTDTDSGYPEHAFTWDVSVRLEKILRARGAKVVKTRPDDKGVGPCVDKRAEVGNQAHADAVLAVHGDGAPKTGHGFHVILPALLKGHNDKVVGPARKLGIAVRDSYHTGTGLPYATYLGKDGLDTRDDLGGLNLSKVPAVFIECGNMKNTGDAAKMTDPQFRQRMAVALADGIARFLT